MVQFAGMQEAAASFVREASKEERADSLEKPRLLRSQVRLIFSRGCKIPGLLNNPLMQTASLGKIRTVRIGMAPMYRMLSALLPTHGFENIQLVAVTSPCKDSAWYVQPHASRIDIPLHAWISFAEYVCLATIRTLTATFCCWTLN